MPKKVAKTKQKSPRKSQKNNKLKSFLAKLNPKTTKAKLIAFALVFSLLGGGYYAYDTFALHYLATYEARHWASQPGAKTMTIKVDNGKRNVTGAWIENGSKFQIRNVDRLVAEWGHRRFCFEVYNSRRSQQVHFRVNNHSMTKLIHPSDNLQTHCLWEATFKFPYNIVNIEVTPLQANLIFNKVTIQGGI